MTLADFLSLVLPALSIGGSSTAQGNLISEYRNSYVADELLDLSLGVFSMPTSRNDMTGQAFKAAVDALLEDWLFMWTTASASDRTKNAYYSAMENLKALSQWIEAVRGLKGCNLVNALYEILLRTGHENHRRTLEHLLTETAQPMMRMLQNAVRHGLVYDPYNEFFLVQRPFVPQMAERWWETGLGYATAGPEKPVLYASSAPAKETYQKVPTFLKSISDKCLLTAKLWSVLRQCSGEHNTMDDEAHARLYFSMDKLEFSYLDLKALERQVEESFHHANFKVLTLLFGRFDLLSQVRLMKHYYLCAQADYLSSFLESAWSTLQSNRDQISLTRLQAILSLAVRTSSSTMAPPHQPLPVSAADLDDDKIKAELSPTAFLEMLLRVISVTAHDDPSKRTVDADAGLVYHQTGDLTGLTCFTLSTHLPFPLSLMFSHKTHQKYQLLFRQFFTLTSVLHGLTESSGTLRSLCRSLDKSDHAKNAAIRVFKDAWLLTTKMMSTIRGLTAFISERIEVLFQRFELELRDIRRQVLQDKNIQDTKITFDGLLKRHDQFLDESLKEALLTNRQLLLAQHGFFQQCTRFAMQTSRLSRAVEQDLSILFARASPTSSRSLVDMYREVVHSAQTQYETLIQKMEQVTRVVVNTEGDGNLGGVTERVLGI